MTPWYGSSGCEGRDQTEGTVRFEVVLLQSFEVSTPLTMSRLGRRQAYKH